MCLTHSAAYSVNGSQLCVFLDLPTIHTNVQNIIQPKKLNYTILSKTLNDHRYRTTYL